MRAAAGRLCAAHCMCAAVPLDLGTCYGLVRDRGKQCFLFFIFYFYFFSQADRLIVTLPNNILRDGDVVFKPPLSSDKVYTHTQAHTHIAIKRARTHTHTLSHTHTHTARCWLRFMYVGIPIFFFRTFFFICILASD